MFEPKRSLGQNFFTNKNLALKIAGLVLSENPKSVVEIGPGTGSFTSLLSPEIPNYVAIEKDQELASYLGNLFKGIEVINQDILEVDLTQINTQGATVVFGSLPYNISKKIIQKFITSGRFKSLFFIIQKEVAQKYVAADGKTSLLSMTTQLYAKPKILLSISPESFHPRPKVNSSLIHFTVDKVDITKQQEEKVLSIMKLAFRNPRKTLKNNLGLDESREELKPYLMKRAQELSLREFVELSEIMI